MSKLKPVVGYDDDDDYIRYVVRRSGTVTTEYCEDMEFNSLYPEEI